MTNQYNIAIADDHKLILSGIRNIILDNNLGNIVGEVNNGLQMLKLLQVQKVNLIILDINMPELNGIETAKKVIDIYPEISILMLSQYENLELIKELKNNGVKGYLSKNFETNQLIQSIEAIKQNNVYFPSIDIENNISKIDKNNLTSREIEVITLISLGKTSKEIANQLFLSQYTVETHRKNCMRKLEVSSTINLMNIAKEKGYIF